METGLIRTIEADKIEFYQGVATVKDARISILIVKLLHVHYTRRLHTLIYTLIMDDDDAAVLSLNLLIRKISENAWSDQEEAKPFAF